MMNYPRSPMATLLENIFAVKRFKEEKKERDEDRAFRRSQFEFERKRFDLENRRREEESRLDELPIDQFLPDGHELNPAYRGRKTGEVRTAIRMGLVKPDQIFVDPRARAQESIGAAQGLAKLFDIPQTIQGGTLQRAYPGVQFPLGAGSGVTSDMIPRGAPGAGVTSETPAPLTIGGRESDPIVNVPQLGPMRASQAVKIVGAEGVRKLLGIDQTEKSETVPVTEGGQTLNVTPGQALTHQRQQKADALKQFESTRDSLIVKIQTRVSKGDAPGARQAATALDELANRAPGIGTTGAAELQKALDARRQLAEKDRTEALRHQLMLAALARGARGGTDATETWSKLRLGIATGEIDPKKLTPEGRKLLGLTDKGMDPDLAAIQTAQRAAQVKVQGLRGRVGAGGGMDPVAGERAKADLAAAEAELSVWNQLLLGKTKNFMSPAQGLPPQGSSRPATAPRGASRNEAIQALAKALGRKPTTEELNDFARKNNLTFR